MATKGWILVGAMFLLNACTTLPAAPSSDADDNARDIASGARSAANDGSSEAKVEISKLIEEANSEFAEHAGDGEKMPLQIPPEIEKRVLGWIKFFTVRKPEMTQRYLERGEALRPHLEVILKENEVPQELFYLAMIESGFVTHAKSRAKAVGIWQFVTGTGRNYGMVINRSVDERRNWIKATNAAIAYLKDLYNVFGSWYLAMAAYNAGEYRIVRSIMKGKTRDFWLLAEQGLLPQETMDYIPKFLAAHIVGKNFKRLGFEVSIDPEDQWDPWETVSVPSGVKLTDLSKTTGTSLEVLQRWNRDLLKGTTPFSKTGSVDIFMPKAEAARFEDAKAEIAGLRRHLSPGDEQQIVEKAGKGGSSFQFYVVRRGDNLTAISKRIGTNTRTLMKINGLKRGRIHPGQRLKFYANPPSAEADGPVPRSKRGLASSREKRHGSD